MSGLPYNTTQITKFVALFVALCATKRGSQFATLQAQKPIRVSQNIISGHTRTGGTMKKLSVPMILALLLAILVVGTTLAASARKQLPLKGSFQALETYQPNLPTIFVTATGSGEATRLGRFTMSYEVTVNVQTGVGSGLSAHFVAANGDSLFAEGSGQATPTETPGVLKIVETYTITGGTGRFAGASGTFTVERMANQATGETSGTMGGTIILP
jgi:hypothetical protein